MNSPDASARDTHVLADPERAESLLAEAANRGVNLAWAGTDGKEAAAALALLEKTGLAGEFGRIIEYRGKTEAGLAAFLAEAGRGPRDILLVRADDAADVARLREAGTFRAATRAKAGGAAFLAGWSVPADPQAIDAALEAFPDADLWACEYSYLNRGIADAIARAAADELGFISLDPFAEGLLERVPPEVHAFFHDAPVPRAHDEWALRAVWESQDLVSAVAYPGSVADLVNKAIFAESGRANSLPSRETAVIAAAAEKLNARTR